MMMLDLSDVSDAALEKEIERRRNESIPVPVSNPDWSDLIRYCNGHINLLAQKGYAWDDSEHRIYGAALKAVFGPNVFDWINQILR
jgi:hypothetical protein